MRASADQAQADARQAHDGRSAADMLGTLGDGDVLLADRAYDSDALRIEMAARDAWANITPMPNRKRRPAFSAFLYRYRHLVERFFNKAQLSLSKGSKRFRAVVTPGQMSFKSRGAALFLNPLANAIASH